jgi:hypothetical protein
MSFLQENIGRELCAESPYSFLQKLRMFQFLFKQRATNTFWLVKALVFLNLDTKWRQVSDSTLQPL